MNVPDVYLLSIGINQYKSDEIANLNGSVKDVCSLQEKLQEAGWVAKTKCQLLLNEEATRENIILNFRTHFDQLKDGDLALLHFSGHGSWEVSGEEFISSEVELAGGRNETLVCYDSRSPRVYNIADKELRILIAEIQKERKNTLFVGIYDCCHSGSLMKDDNLRIKHSKSLPGLRPIESYLNGTYYKMLLETEKIKIPNIDYISLTACSHKEYAYENEDGGIFTNAIIEALSYKNQFSTISYSALHAISRSIVQNKTVYKQNPYLEFEGQSNPFHLFLSKKNSLERLPLLTRRGAEWLVNLGAIHSLEYSISRQNKIPLYLLENLASPIGYASVKEIYLEETVVTPKWKNSSPDKGSQICIDLFAEKIPILIRAGDSKIEAAFKKKLFGNIILEKQFLNSNNTKYEVAIQGNSICLYQNKSKVKNLITGYQGKSSYFLDWLSHQLLVIEKWENLQSLRTPKDSTISQESILFCFSYLNPSGKKTISSSADRIIIPIQKNEKPIPYTIRVENKHANLHGVYFYLLHLDRKFKVAQKHAHYIKPIMSGASVKLYDSNEHGSGLGILDFTTQTSEDTFILIGAESPLFSPQSFIHEGFKETFGKIVADFNLTKMKQENDRGRSTKAIWIVKKITVKLCRVD